MKIIKTALCYISALLAIGGAILAIYTMGRLEAMTLSDAEFVESTITMVAMFLPSIIVGNLWGGDKDDGI